jgi:hypothetical protein
MKKSEIVHKLNQAENMLEKLANQMKVPTSKFYSKGCGLEDLVEKLRSFSKSIENE